MVRQFSDTMDGSRMSGAKVGGMAALILGGFVALIGLLAVFGSFYTVNQQDRGVVLRNGAFQAVADPGLHFKLPFFDDVKHISLRNKLWRVDKPLEGYSHDQQSAHYTISVQYQIDASKVRDTYVSYNGEDGLVSTVLVPNVLKLSKVVIGQYTAQTSIQDRAKLNDGITDLLQGVIKGTPLIVTSVNVEDIQFGAEYMKSINDRMIAEVAVQTQRQNLEKERVLAQIKVTQAQAIADSTLAQAKADAQKIELQGNAEAKAIQARGTALGQNPSLVSLTAAERWNGIMPTHMIPGGATPFVNLNQDTPPRTTAAR